MTVGNIPRHLIAFSIPLLAGNFIEAAYNLTNAVWIGRGLGKTDLAAMSASLPIIFIISAAAMGMSAGTGILAAQYFGAKNEKNLSRAVHASCILLFVLSVIVAVTAEIFTPTVLRALNTPENVLPEAVKYLRIIMYPLPFLFGAFRVLTLMRAVGDSRTPLIFQITSLVLNAVLDPILMFGWLGFPRMGIAGAAWATNVAHVYVYLAPVIYLYVTKGVVATHIRQLKNDWEMTKLILKMGTPAFVQNSIVSMSTTVVLGLVNGFGENAVATFGSALRIDGVIVLPAAAVAAAVSTMVAQNVGAGKIRRVKKIYRWGLYVSGLTTAIVAAFVYFFPRLAIGMFTTDPILLDMGTDYLRIIAPTYLFLAVIFVTNGVISGAGHPLIPTITVVSALCGIRLPLAYHFSRTMHSVNGVWYGIGASFFVSMMLSIIMYSLGFWKKQAINTADPAEIKEEK